MDNNLEIIDNNDIVQRKDLFTIAYVTTKADPEIGRVTIEATGMKSLVMESLIQGIAPLDLANLITKSYPEMQSILLLKINQSLCFLDVVYQNKIPIDKLKEQWETEKQELQNIPSNNTQQNKEE